MIFEFCSIYEKNKIDILRHFMRKLQHNKKPRFGVRPEHIYRSENSVQQSKQGAHRQSHEALAAQEKTKGST